MYTNTVHTNERCDNVYVSKAATGEKGDNLAPGDLETYVVSAENIIS